MADTIKVTRTRKTPAQHLAEHDERIARCEGALEKARADKRAYIAELKAQRDALDAHLSGGKG